MCQYGGKSKTLEAAQTWQDGPQLGPCPPKVTVASTYCVPGKSRPSPGPAPALGTEALGHGGCFFLSGDSPGRKCLHHSPGQHQAAHRLNLTDLRSQGSTSPINTQGSGWQSWQPQAHWAFCSEAPSLPPTCLPAALRQQWERRGLRPPTLLLRFHLLRY